MKNIFRYAVLNSLLTTGYIAIVASLMNYITSNQRLESVNSVIAGIIMITLLVMSVAVVGTTIFGRPLMWYLDGQKKEAIKLLLSTLGAIAVIWVIFIVILLTSLR